MLSAGAKNCEFFKFIFSLTLKVIAVQNALSRDMMAQLLLRVHIVSAEL